MAVAVVAADGVEASPGRRWAWWAAGVVALVPVVFTVVWLGLNHDVRYVLGGLRVGDGSAAETFVHRPLSYRLTLAALESVSPGGVQLREAVLRGVAVLGVGAVALWLRAALARHMPRAQASAVAAGVGLALALAPNWGFLQPEWVAAVAAVAAVAGSLGFRRVAVSALVGGVFLALAVVMKYTTAPLALVAFGAVAAVSRRRAWWSLAASVPAAGALFGLAVLVEPREWRWLFELPSLNRPNPVTTGALHLEDLRLLGTTLANEALMAPLLAALPVTLVVLARTGATARERVAWVLLPVLGVGAVLVGVVAQAQWYQYHVVALAILAAGLWGLAVTRWSARFGRVPWVLVLTTGGLGAAVPVAAARPQAWRLEHGAAVYLALAAVVLVATAAAAVSRGAPARSGAAGFVVVLAGVAGLSAPVWPSSPYSFDQVHSAYTNAERVRVTEERLAQLDRAHSEISADTRVAYLAFGDMGYLAGNPTSCRYPSPVFLQRSTFLPGVEGLASYRENLACLDDPRIDYLVLQPSWFQVGALPEDARTVVTGRFACERGIPYGELVFCPRR